MPREVSDAIYARLQGGASLRRVASELGCNHAQLYRLMGRRYGYKAREFRRSVWSPTLTAPEEPADAAYIAGIIDGEGSIIQINRGSTNPLWCVKVNMTDRPVIEWLYSFGGRFSVRPARGPHLKEQYEWRVNRQIDVYQLLFSIKPYMRVKRAKAEEATAFLRSHQHLDDDGRAGQRR